MPPMLVFWMYMFASLGASVLTDKFTGGGTFLHFLSMALYAAAIVHPILIAFRRMSEANEQRP